MDKRCKRCSSDYLCKGVPSRLAIRTRPPGGPHDQVGNLAGRGCSDVVSEVGSEMNEQRRILSQLLADATTTTIVVEHRDSLVSFGVEHSEAALSAKDRRFVVGSKKHD